MKFAYPLPHEVADHYIRRQIIELPIEISVDETLKKYFMKMKILPQKQFHPFENSSGGFSFFYKLQLGIPTSYYIIQFKPFFSLPASVMCEQLWS